MKIKIVSQVLILFLTVSTSLVAQTSNIFLDRSYWKQQPSIESIQKHQAAGHDIRAFNRHKMNPTCYAILENNPLTTVQFLIEQGLDVNQRTHDERTYVFWAAYKGNLSLMNYLVSKGAQMDLLDDKGNTVLLFIAATGQQNTAVYDYCIDQGNKINATNPYGQNALLLYAQYAGEGHILDYFTKKGLDIYSKDAKGNGLFYYAVKSANVSLLDSLIAKGLPIAKNEKTNSNAFLSYTKWRRGNYTLKVSFLEYLEKLGLDPVIVSKDGQTALHNIAYAEKNPAIFSFFLERGASLHQLNKDGDTPLLVAAAKGDTSIVSMLATTEIITTVNKKKETALSKAMLSNSIEVVTFLLSKGGTLKIINKEGYDLAYQLVRGQTREMAAFEDKITFLKKHGFDMLKKQKDKSTLLHAAVRSGNSEVLRYMLQEQIPLNVQNNQGETALHLATMQAKDATLIKILLDAGVDTQLRTILGESAYDLAKQNEMLQDKNTIFELLK